MRRELGEDAVVVQTRSLLRDDAEPLIEVLAKPSDRDDAALTLALQEVMVQGTLARVEAAPTVRLTVGDLEDIAAREEADWHALQEFDFASHDSLEIPTDPAWFEGFVSTSGLDRPDLRPPIKRAIVEPIASPLLFTIPTVLPPSPLQWAPRPQILTRGPGNEAVKAPRDQEAPASGHGRTFRPVEPGNAGGLIARGFSPEASRRIAMAAPPSATPQQCLEAALATAGVSYPVEGRTAVITIQGSAGSGRTTALIRMALDCADSGREAILVAADSSHAGGRAQVHAYGEAIGLAVFDAFGPHDIANAVLRAPKGACIFIDVPAGRWSPPANPAVEHYLYIAIPAHWQPGIVEAAMTEFEPSICAGAVLTGTDLATVLTPAISIIVESQLGIAFLSSGRDIATGIGIADPLTLASGVFTTTSRETTNGRLAVTA